MKLAITIVLAVLLLFCGTVVTADEGMWMPHQMKDLNLKAKGLTMDPGDLYKEDGTGLMSAVVSLGFGTAGFVSKNGLMLTNHHVAFRAIQTASDKKNDYLTNGFLAKNLGEEIPAAGYHADVLLGYKDVTAIVNKKLKKKMTPDQRQKAIDAVKKKLVAQGEKAGPDIRCSFKSMYSGNKYYLFTFKRLQDVRLVYAPRMSIGNFGGNIDNWMWPRHTGDFTYIRAYVSKDNIGKAYSKDNVPYKPKSIIKVSTDGLKKGDFTFLMGYPGSTNRNYTTSQYLEVMEVMKWQNMVDTFLVDYFVKAGKDDRAIQIKYASWVKRLKNYLKNRTGTLEGIELNGITAKKKAKDKKLMDWIAKDPERKKKYADILKSIDAFMKDKKAFYQKERQLSALVSDLRGPKVLSQAYSIYRTVSERQKKDSKREAKYQERNFPGIKDKIRFADRGFVFETDKGLFKMMMHHLRRHDKADQPTALASILSKSEADIDAWVDDLYGNSVLEKADKRLELVNMKLPALMKLKDPMIQLAGELEKELKVLRKKLNIVKQELKDLSRVYLAAMLEMTGGKIAPDANGSTRFTYGPIKGYSPKDAVEYTPFTTVSGVVAKDTGKRPFDVPAKLKKLHDAKDFGRYADKDGKSVTVCFLNTTNVTGGSSGSPVFNGRGELIGLVFRYDL